MLTPVEFLQHPEIKPLIQRYQKAKLLEEQYAFNIFNLSSYNNQLENFHSDIIYFLLRPDELHGEGDHFLQLFIAYLNDRLNLQLDPADFIGASVEREEGRIDVGIIGKRTAIIIENKINNADDQDDQLLRYYLYITHQRKKEVRAVVYLTLLGHKPPPAFPEISTELMKGVGAYTNKENDLVHGWLFPAKEKSRNNDDTFSFINQYTKLLVHLASENMTAKEKEEFYDFLSTHDSINTAKAVGELLWKMPGFRRDRLLSTLTNVLPFKKVNDSYSNAGILLENYTEDKYKFKIDLYFYDNGTARLIFWCPSHPGEPGKQPLEKKLQEIDLEHQMSVGPDYKYYKDFSIANHGTMQAVDNTVKIFLHEFLNRLRSLKRE